MGWPGVGAACLLLLTWRTWLDTRVQSVVRFHKLHGSLIKFWFPYKVAASFQEGTQMGGLQHWYCGMRKSQKIYVYCISILLIPIAGVGLLMLALLFYLKLGSDEN